MAQFIYCCRLMAFIIPNVSGLSHPLALILEEAYKKSGRRTNRSNRMIRLQDLSRSPNHEQSFKDLQDCLRHSLIRSQPDRAITVCVYTAVSDRYWSGLVTQIEEQQLSLPLEEQRHLPLRFLGDLSRQRNFICQHLKRKRLQSFRHSGKWITCFMVRRSFVYSLIPAAFF